MILVSRPRPQLPRTVAALKRAGFEPLPLPLADYESFTLSTFPADATALILTSAAALTALMQAIRTAGPMEKRPGCLRFLPAYCIGAATARAARKAGLNVAYAGKGNAAALAEYLLRTANGKRQTFLHLHASNATTAWAATLEKAGHQVAGLSAYHTAYLHSLPPQTVKQLKQQAPSATLLFSPAGAKRLSHLLKQANLKPSGRAIAISSEVAKAAKPFWPQVAIAAKPTLAGMMKTLKEQTR